jgi:hypothetical protein
MKFGSLNPFKSSSASESDPKKQSLPAGFRAGRRGSSDDAIQRARVTAVSPRSADDTCAFSCAHKYPSTSAEAQANQVAALSLLDQKEYCVRQR